jgi:elongation factor Ts
MAQQPVTAALIKELRERTGVGMGKCKEALETAKGDIDQAIADLRKSGLASAVKKEGRATNEGMIGAAEGPSGVGLVEVNSETDFVARNERFQQFVSDVAQAVASSGSSDLDSLLNHQITKDGHKVTVDQYRATLIQTIGENIQVKRIKSFKKSGNNSIGIYSHLGGKIVTIVELSGSNGEEALAKDIAMHVAAASPDYLSSDDVPADILAKEREIAESQVKGKPANIVDKIVEGKLSAFYDTNCLARQKYIKNDQLTIVELVEQRAKATGKPLKLAGFTRWGIGQA